MRPDQQMMGTFRNIFNFIYQCKRMVGFQILVTLDKLRLYINVWSVGIPEENWPMIEISIFVKISSSRTELGRNKKNWTRQRTCSFVLLCELNGILNEFGCKSIGLFVHSEFLRRYNVQKQFCFLLCCLFLHCLFYGTMAKVIEIKLTIINGDQIVQTKQLY